MEIILNLILIAVGFISFLPVINMLKSSKDMKYRCLMFLMNTTFVWTLLIYLERLSENVNVIYYAHILGYPIKFLLASFLFCTIYNYIERSFPKPLYYVLGVLFIVEFAFAITNNQT